MKLLLFAVFVLSSLTFAYFMVTFLRELRKSIAKQEPIPVGILVLVLAFIIIMFAEAFAAITILLHLQ